MPRKTKPPDPPPKKHQRGWHQGTVKEVRPGTWRAWRERVRHPDGSTVRPSRTFKGEGAEQRAKVWAAGDVEPAVLLLGHWLDHWLALVRPTIARNTYSLYRRHAAACAPLATRPLAELTTDEWQLLTNQLLDRYSRHHVYVWRGNISGALARAVPRHIQENPLARVRLPKADEQPPKAWRQDEVDRLLIAAAGGIHETWLIFSLGTGVRLGESRALLWADVDMQAKTATIRRSADNRDGVIGPTKTRKVRTIDIPDEVIPYLAEHAKHQTPGELLIFGHNGRPYGSNAMRRWLTLQCKAAKVKLGSPHSLRHSYASLALDDGVPIQDIARQLGHASIQTTMKIYSHFIGDGQRRAAKAIGKALSHRFSGPKHLPRAKDGSQT